MRNDMKHVIIDRPRFGAGDGGKSPTPKGKARQEQRIPLDERPKRESMSRHRLYGWGCKQLNEHLGPLRRYLRTNCGRPWNDVFSEICEHLRIDSATQLHVHQHIEDYVLTTTCLINGQVCDSRGNLIGQPRGNGWFWRHHLFHVDPRDGTLRQSPKPRWHTPGRKYKRRESEFVRVHGADYRYHNGRWYEVTFQFVPSRPWNARPGEPNPTVFDVVFEEFIDATKASELYGSQEYIASKRRLGKKELHDLKLWKTSYGKSVLASQEPTRIKRKKPKKR
ncbi:MAG: hypothetical protein ACFCD0_07230 [Gemmataceae bacterium]